MPRPAPGVHYLRPNHADWTPKCVIYLDSETRSLPDREPEVMALRCWAATIEDRRPSKRGKQETRHGSGATTAELIAWLEDVLVGRDSVWLYAHNLSFDLVTTRLPLALVEAGWEITEAAVSGRAPWLRASKGGHVLTMTDSWSWLPTSLKGIGAAVGVRKPELPTDADEDSVWLHRCKTDVAILQAAISGLMDWWDRNQLGHWSLSGAGCGWNAYRHIKSMYRVTIDPTAEGQAEDRQYVHGGRRGTWRIGDMRAGPFVELDFVAAYPTIARDVALPIKRSRPFDSLPLDSHLLRSGQFDVAAHVRVRTDVPRWPVKVNRHTWYPTGEFWTYLAGPEIRDAHRLGCLLEIGPGRVHKMGYAMSEWATWCLAVQNGHLEDCPPVARLAAKNWGRAVIGKWASRSFERVQLGPSPEPGWSYEDGWDQASGTKGGMVDIGGKRWWQSASAVAENAYPAVLAWVESEVRVRLSRVIEAIGPGAVLQCDTDGLIVAMRTVGTRAARGHLVAPEGMSATARLVWVLDQIDPIVAPLTLRRKRTASHVTILGPQHTVVGGQRRFAGIPKDAKDQPDGSIKITTWPKLQWQMKNGSPEGYVRPEITRVIKGPYATGWVTARRTVIPVTAESREDRTTRILDWHHTEGKAKGDTLDSEQHPKLESLW